MQTLQFNLKEYFKSDDNYKVELEKIYERFPLYEGMTTDERKKIVDDIINKLSHEEQTIFMGYVNREYNSYDEKYKKYKVLIDRLRREYKRRTINKIKINIYDLFPLHEGMTTDDRKRVVDDIINKLSHEEQTIFMGYINKEYDMYDERYERYKTILAKLVRKYNRLTTNKIILRARIDIYERFPLYNGITSDERREIVDNIINSLSSEEQTILEDYLDKKIGAHDESYKLYKLVLEKIRRRYNKKAYFYNTIKLIEEKYQIKINDKKTKRMPVLIDALGVIEYIYCNRYQMSKDNYLNYFNQRFLELFDGSSYLLEDLLVLYINTEYEIIKRNAKRGD